VATERAAYWSTFAARLFGAFAWITVGAVVAHQFGPDTRGAVEDLYVLRLGLHAVVGLGAPAAATFLVARDPALLPSVVRTASAAVLALGALGAAVLVTLAVLAPSLFHTIPVAWTIAFAASAPVVLAAQVLPAVLLGAGRPVAWNVASAAGRVSLLLSLALLAIPEFRRPETVVLGMIASEVVVVAVAATALRTSIVPRVDRVLVARAAAYVKSAWLHTSLAFGLVRTDVLLLAALAGTAAAGLYATAGVSKEIILFLSWIAGMLHMPRVASATAAGSTAPAPRAIGAGSVATALAAAVALEVFAEPFVVITGGDRFRDAASLVRILVPASLVTGAANLGLQELLGRGAPRAAWLAPGAALVVSVAGNLLFVRAGGATATAWTTLASSIVLAAVTALGLRQARRATAARRDSTTGP